MVLNKKLKKHFKPQNDAFVDEIYRHKIDQGANRLNLKELLKIILYPIPRDNRYVA